jgi:hypothetical protein
MTCFVRYLKLIGVFKISKEADEILLKHSKPFAYLLR